MPTPEDILGFANKWYAEAFAHAVNYRIDDVYQIKIFSSSYFIATKLEAYKNRGQNDGRTSSDFEDIIFVMNNRTTIWQEIADTPNNLKQYFKSEFKQLLSNHYFDEWISCHLEYYEQRRVSFIIGNIEEFVNG